MLKEGDHTEDLYVHLSKLLILLKWDGVDCFYRTQDRDQWQVAANTATNFRVL